jgi:hypothetical protein
MDFAERVTVDGIIYSIDTFPLEPYRTSLPSRPRFRGWPSCSNGYYATWDIQDHGQDRILCLVRFRAQVEDALALLFPQPDLPLDATWSSGIIRGCRGDRRYTGYPPRTFYDDEIYVEIVSGRVVREWVLDLRSVPDQTAEEWRLSVPAFMWKS